MCKKMLSNLAQTFGNNQQLQFVSQQAQAFPDDSQIFLTLLSTHVMQHSAAISNKDVSLFEHKDIKSYSDQWKIKAMYESLSRSDKETFWTDLDDIVKKVKIIKCAGPNINQFESVAKDLIDNAGIKELKEGERNIPNVLMKVLKSISENKEIASKCNNLITSMDENAQMNILQTMGMGDIVEKLKESQNITEEMNSLANEAAKHDHTDENIAFLNSDGNNQSDNNAFLGIEQPGQPQEEVVVEEVTEESRQPEGQEGQEEKSVDHVGAIMNMAQQFMKSPEYGTFVNKMEGCNVGADKQPDIQQMMQLFSGDQMQNMMRNLSKHMPKPAQ